MFDNFSGNRYLIVTSWITSYVVTSSLKVTLKAETNGARVSYFMSVTFNIRLTGQIVKFLTIPRFSKLLYFGCPKIAGFPALTYERDKRHSILINETSCSVSFFTIKFPHHVCSMIKRFPRQ